MATFPLFAENAPGLVGIARLASHGVSLSEGHNVEYLTLPARSLLSRCDSKRVPFDWTMNPYRGCEFACKYCYARYTHEFMEMRDGLDFERRIFAKQNAGWLLRRDLKRVKPGEQIAIGAATDPYQPAERRYRVTREILEELARHSGLRIGIISKSTLILRDIDVLQAVARSNQLGIAITVTTMDIALARKLEPRAPRPDLRIETVRRLRAASLDAGVLCAPVLPGITDAPASLTAVARNAAGAGACWFSANSLFLMPCSEKIFMPFLELEFPELVEQYRRRYASRAFVGEVYRKRLSELVRKLRAKYGFNRERYPLADESPNAEREPQMALF